VSSGLSALGSDPDHPQFLPAIGMVLNVGQPNADTLYRTAKITPGATYRMRGRRGALNQCKIGQVVPRNVETGSGRAYLDVNALTVDGDDMFDVMIGPERPAGWNGDFWELGRHANSLMLRMVAQDWAGEASPTFAIERIDRPMARGRDAADVVEARLRGLPPAIEFIATMFVDHVEQLRQEGFVNRFKEFDVSQIGGLTGQFYYESVFELGPDDALIIESEVPAVCPYRSIILTNEIYETINWYDNHASLNGAQAAPDSDGRLRFVVSPRDPGVRNWLDTAGHPTGIIQGRWTDCDSQPIPTVRQVKLADVFDHLPADVARVSAEERQAILRDRRAAYLQRPHW